MGGQSLTPIAADVLSIAGSSSVKKRLRVGWKKSYGDRRTLTGVDRM